MKKQLMACLMGGLACQALSLAASAETFQLNSPKGDAQLSLSNTNQGLQYSLMYQGKTVLAPSALGLIIDGQPIGKEEMQFVGKEEKKGQDSFTLVAGRTKQVDLPYQEATYHFVAKDKRALALDIVLRAYDSGVALRYQLPNQSGLKQFTIQNEITRFAFAGDYRCFGLNLGKFANSHEGEFDPIQASHIREHNLFDNPLVCKTGEGQTTFALAESNVRHYPGSWFSGRGDGGLGVETNLTPRFDNRKDGLEKSAVKVEMGNNAFTTPWRVVMLGATPGQLTESSLIAALGEPTEIKDTSWIKPGKVSWDWWNDNQVTFSDAVKAKNTNLKPGMNTETYKAYIDFAATLGLEYILIDAGWHEGAAWTSTPGSNVIKPIADMNMPEILAYAKSKKVGVWVWLQWKQLDWQMEEALSTYEKWGIKGIKVDFMDRSDQEIVDYYHKLLSATANHKIMVDLHGAFPPNGLVRTYPHYMTQEGVMGAEYNKWSQRITATHNVTLPYTRMILGPIDYTPGGFRHATKEDFGGLRRNTLPYVQTTRGQALAMYVVFDSPIQMLADSPITYAKTEGPWPKPKSDWADGLEFIQQVPTTWDETRIVQGDIGQYIVSVRRKGKDWYIGAMTNEQARDIELPLDFLSKGKFAAAIWQDGTTVSSLVKSTKAVNNQDSLKLHLAASGGAAIYLKAQ